MKKISGPRWPKEIHAELRAANVRQVAYVPDAGHAELIRLCRADRGMHAISLTTEEEGVALAAGAWLGGERSVLLMQSSGVGNRINMLSVQQECRMPFLALVTMRGEWGEFNSWQVPMGRRTEAVLDAAGVNVYRAEAPEHIAETVRAGIHLAFDAYRSVAVLIAQRAVGTKTFGTKTFEKAN